MGHGMAAAVRQGYDSVIFNPGDGDEYVIMSTRRVISVRRYQRSVFAVSAQCSFCLAGLPDVPRTGPGSQQRHACDSRPAPFVLLAVPRTRPGLQQWRACGSKPAGDFVADALNRTSAQLHLHGSARSAFVVECSQVYSTGTTVECSQVYSTG